MLPFSIELKPGLPITEQVIFAVKKAVVAGQLKPGQAFPSVRVVSQELQINPNTAHKIVAALVAQGIGLWIGVQAIINMGVNMGVLPTKGLTLPLMSYGGSAILMNCVALAIVLRVDIENRQLMRGGRA